VISLCLCSEDTITLPNADCRMHLKGPSRKKGTLHRCWKKCGAVPLTRLPLESSQVRHELTFEGNVDSKESQRLRDLAQANQIHCDILTTNGFYGGALNKGAPKMKKKLSAVSVPQSKERITAIRNAKASGQLFHATGGRHLNSDDFFQARAQVILNSKE